MSDVSERLPRPAGCAFVAGGFGGDLVLKKSTQTGIRTHAPSFVCTSKLLLAEGSPEVKTTLKNPIMSLPFVRFGCVLSWAEIL